MALKILEKLKALMFVKKAVAEGQKDVVAKDGTRTKGWKTSEFWVAHGTAGIVLYNGLYKDNINPDLAIGLTVGIESVYVGGRNLIKIVRELVDHFFGRQDAPGK